jgi:hypothetical protein
MIRLFNLITDNDLSPNGLYMLICILEKKQPLHINKNLEMIRLESLGLVKNGELTQEGFDKTSKLSDLNGLIKILNKQSSYKITEEDIEKIKEYRELFPKGLLPSGYPARVQIKELEKKFNWFFNNYEYSWDVIITATKKYISQYKANDYTYMKTSGYFISKLEKNGIVSSLASYCDMVVDGDDTEQTTYITHNTL